jgi:hypothetical protein
LNKKSFGKGSGRSHFPELTTQNLTTYNASTWFIEVDTDVEISDLLDPACWGPQKLVRRGDMLHVLRADNAFFGAFVCVRVAAGHPSFEPLAIRDRQTHAKPKRIARGEPRQEFHLGAGLVRIENDEIVGIAGVDKLAQPAEGNAA